MDKGRRGIRPKPRSYAMKVNKKIKKLAMVSALSDKVANEELIVLDALKLDAAKTKGNGQGSFQPEGDGQSPDRHGREG